jgi:predicted peptidase
MKKILFAGILLSSFNTIAQDLSLYQKRTYINEKKDTLRYRILFPENYEKTKKYPLVLFLHGAGERGRDNEKQLTHGAKLFLAPENRKNFPCIVLFPQCPSESFWSSMKADRSKTPMVFDFDYARPANTPLVSSIEVVNQMIKEEGVDKKRVYVTGLSMGGMGTFEAVYKCPKLFAAALPICGGGDVKSYDARVKKVPFWVFHGSVDAVVDVKYSREMVERLRALNARVKYSEYPGVNHNSWDNAFAEPEFLGWMLSKKK